MARVSEKPRYYKSKKAWYANLNGERILLVRGSRNESEEVAKERYRQEVEGRRVETEGDRNTVWAVLNAYIVDCENRVKNEEFAENTLKMHRLYLTPFSEKYGQIKVRDLRPQHINNFLAEMR